ncbi:unnamed protein product [Brassica rapa subsp. narinosa]
MYSCGIFREVEASADPPPLVRASGKRVFFSFAFAGFQLWRAEATKDPRFHLGSRCSLRKRFEAAEKNGLRSLKTCRVLSSDERGSLSVFVPVASRWRRLSRDGDDA